MTTASASQRSMPTETSTRILWVAFTILQPILGVLAFVVTGKTDQFASIMNPASFSGALSRLTEDSMTLVIPILAIGLGALLASRIVPPILAKSMKGAQPASPNAPLGVAAPWPLQARLVQYSMIEFCGLTGFIAAFLTKEPLIALPSLGLAFACMLLAKPR